MGHAEAEQEPAAADQAESERTLRQQHRVLILDRDDAGAHLDPADLTEGDSEHGQQVRFVGHLGHPDPPESLVVQLREILYCGVDRGAATGVTERGDEAGLHGTTLRAVWARRCGDQNKKGRVREDTWGRFNSSHAAGLSPLYRLFGSVTPEPVVGSIVRLGYPSNQRKVRPNLPRI